MRGLSTSLVEKGQKLVLLDVGFAGVSSVPMISSKVGLGSEPVSGPLDGKTAKRSTGQRVRFYVLSSPGVPRRGSGSVG